MRYKIGLMVFSENLAREDVYRQRKPIQDREVQKFIHRLEDRVDFQLNSFGSIRSKKDIAKAVAEFEQSGVLAVVLYIPIFITPVYVAIAARLLNKPLILMGNMAKDTLSPLGFLASGGAIDQVGIQCRRIPGDIADDGVRRRLLLTLQAIAASEQLAGSTFGCIGGRSLGISTGTADAAQWLRDFGVDIEHIDQLEIVSRAERIPDETVRRHLDWVRGNYGGIFYKDGRLGDIQMDRMLRSYLATRSIVAEYELDFIGIKCQTELSNGYCLQCLNVQLLNDPYDADGPKKPVACSCEADHDGALTMQILQLLSGRPGALQDIAYVDDHTMVLANCGAMASYFAALSDNAAENLREVYLQPHVFGEAGGASTQFVVAESDFTFARLLRSGGAYRMAILRGTTVKRPREALAEYSWYRPTSFVSVDIDSKAFFAEYGSNHIHCVPGDFTAELLAFCEYSNIPCTLY